MHGVHKNLFPSAHLPRQAKVAITMVSKGLTGAQDGGTSWYKPHGAGSSGLQNAGFRDHEGFHQNVKKKGLRGQENCSRVEVLVDFP